MNTDILSATIDFKSSNYDRRDSWQTIPLNRIKKRLKSKNSSKFESGQDAIYLHSRVYLDEKTFTYWICLDIEDKNNHDSIPQNIKAAQNLLIFLQEKDLTESLTIMMTGSGFRFVWPWIVPIEYKNAFISWIKQEKDIDSGVQQGNKFIRMLGYRGNPRQGKVKDRHIHKLNHVKDLWSLDEKKYKDLAQGKPDYSQCMFWLDEGILPSNSIPQAWIDFLKRWKIYTDIQQTIWKPSFAPGYSIDYSESWKQIFEFLDEQGLFYSEQTRGDIWFLKLNSCPSCGRGDASPYITATGRLKCHHANTCEAGVLGDKGILGLPPIKWIPGFKTVENPAQTNNQQKKNKTTARAEIKKGLLADGDILMLVDPGVGKTYTTLENEVPKCNQNKILYAGPTHQLSLEVYELSKKFAGKNVPTYYIEGRNETNCKKHKQIKEVAQQGYLPGTMICSTCDQKRNKTCKYFDQFKPFEKSPNGFFVTTHAQLSIFDLDCHGFDTLIIDEDPLQSFFVSSKVEMSEVLEFADGYNGEFFNKIEKACDFVYESADDKDRKYGSHNRLYVNNAPKNSAWEKPNNLFLWKLANITEAELDDVRQHLSKYKKGDDESYVKWQWRLYDDGINVPALNWLWAALGLLDGTAYVRIDLDEKASEYRFVLTRKRLPQFKGRIIFLEGTGDKSEADALFERDFQLVDASLSLDNCVKNLVKRGLGKHKAKKMSPKQMRALARYVVTFLRPQDNKILVATHHIIEDQLMNIFKAMLPEKEINSIHFYGNRGINLYQEYDAIICFGAPGTNQTERLDEAMMLYENQEKHQEWFQHKADAELLQTIHRIRPINGSKNIILITRRWISELGSITYEIDTRKGNTKTTHSLAEAYRRLSCFYKIHGFVSPEIGYALGIGHVSNKDFLEELQVSRSTCLIKDYIYGKRTLKTRLRCESLILFKNKNYWAKLVDRILLEHVGQRYENKVHSQWTKAIGDINAIKAFYRAVGANFNSDNWRKSSDEESIPSKECGDILEIYPIDSDSFSNVT